MQFNKVYTDGELLRKLEQGSAFTFVGLEISDESLQQFIDDLENKNFNKNASINVYITTGKLMNNVYHLTGSNAYPEDLHIVSISLDDLKDIPRLAIYKLQIGARWLDDVVDNNARRELEYREKTVNFYNLK